MRWRYRWQRDEAAEEAYEAHRGLIIDLARKHAGGRDGAYEEALEVACLAFSRAWKSWNKKTKLSTWLTLKVRGALLDWRRAENERNSLLPTLSLSSCPLEGPPRLFGNNKETASEDEMIEDRSSLYQRASPDAKTVISLVLSPPEELRREAGLEALEDEITNPRPLWKWRLIWYLQELGWGIARVLESFEEVKEALRR